MTTYVVAREVLDCCSDLTVGKRYEVIKEAGGGFQIVDDDGDTITCRWKGCDNINGGDWTRVETDEEGVATWTPPEDGVPPPDWQDGWECSRLEDMSDPIISNPKWLKAAEYFYRPPAEEGDYNTCIPAIQLQPPPTPDLSAMSDEELAVLEYATKAERERRADPDRIYHEAFKVILDAAVWIVRVV